jgi:hypothetical protein
MVPLHVKLGKKKERNRKHEMDSKLFFPSTVIFCRFFVWMISKSYKRRTPIAGIRVVGASSIYKVRALRRETLLWINLLNKVSSPLSRSEMSNSKACNCSSSHTTLFFWNAFDTRDHLLRLGITI